VCKRICSASISAAGGYTFVFGDLDPATAGADLVALAEACAASPYGFVAWRDRPQAIRSGIIARVPPPDWSPEDGGAPA
jgi:predicted metal-binding protein